MNPFLNVISAAIIAIQPLLPGDNILSSHQISLEKRHAVESINNIFQDNILLNLNYMEGKVLDRDQIDWDEAKKPSTYSFRLNPGETFAFHDDVLPKYEGKVVKTTNAHFNAQEGFKSSGYLYGDGVCHLASLIYWVALDSGLETEAPTNHNFMVIPEVDKKYGVSIYADPFSKADARQNLYITNNKENPVLFKFEYMDNNLKLSVVDG